MLITKDHLFEFLSFLGYGPSGSKVSASSREGYRPREHIWTSDYALTLEKENFLDYTKNLKSYQSEKVVGPFSAYDDVTESIMWGSKGSKLGNLKNSAETKVREFLDCQKNDYTHGGVRDLTNRKDIFGASEYLNKVQTGPSVVAGKLGIFQSMDRENLKVHTKNEALTQKLQFSLSDKTSTLTHQKKKSQLNKDKDRLLQILNGNFVPEKNKTINEDYPLGPELEEDLAAERDIQASYQREADKRLVIEKERLDREVAEGKVREEEGRV